MMRKVVAGIVAGVVLYSGTPMHPLAAAENCPVIQPDHGRICGDINTALLRDMDEVDGCFTIWVKAASKWNASGVRLAAGRKYELEVADKTRTWADDEYEATALGWSNEAKIKLAKKSWSTRKIIALSEKLRRAPDRNWFYLMGMVAGVGGKIFPIGRKTSRNVEKAGEFCAFANDLQSKYGNNRGSLKLIVRQVD